MNLDTFIELFKGQLPEASDDTIKALAQKALEEATREGDRRATDATKTSIANYEKKHNLKEGKPVGNEESNDDEIPTWAKTLIESNNHLRADLESVKKEKTAETRRTTFEGLIGELPENLKVVYMRTPYAELSDEDFAKLTATIGEEVKGFVSENKTRSITSTPRQPQPIQPDSTASKEEVEAIFSAAPNFGKL